MKAFPTVTTNNEGNEVRCGGMDLRDYFAAKAMQSIMTNNKAFFHKIAELAEKHDESADLVMAKFSYVYADAMMKARENNG